MYTFAFLEKFASGLKQGEDVPQLFRTKEVQDAYDNHKRETPDLAGHIIKNHFQETTCVVLIENKFAYPLEPGVKQYVVWYRDVPYQDAIEFLTHTFHPNAFDTVVFENPPSRKSVPNLAHVHAFVRKHTKL